MITLIQKNQQLFALGILILLVMVFYGFYSMRSFAMVRQY